MEPQLYELPEGWEFTKLGNLFDITSSKRIHKKDWKSKGVPFYRAREVVALSKYGSVDNELFIADDLYDDFLEKHGMPEENDIMVTGVGTIGVCYVVKKQDKFYFKDGNIIWLKNTSGIESRFIEYAFQSEFLRKQINSATGAVVKTYTIIRAKNTILPLCLLDEQKRIVTKLDALFTRIDIAITHLQQTLELSKALFASAMKSEVSGDGLDWPRRSLNSLGGFSGGGTPSKSKSEYWGGYIPWITPKDMKSWELSDSELKITSLAVSKSSAKMLPPNSVLIVARSGILRHTLPVCINRVEATVNQDIKVFIPGNDVMPEYMQYLLKGHEPFILSQLVKCGVTVESLKYKEFQNHVFPIPTISAQRRIIIHLDALSERTRALESATKEKLSDLTALRASLLDAAFKGQF